MKKQTKTYKDGVYETIGLVDKFNQHQQVVIIIDNTGYLPGRRSDLMITNYNSSCCIDEASIGQLLLEFPVPPPKRKTLIGAPVPGEPGLYYL